MVKVGSGQLAGTVQDRYAVLMAHLDGAFVGLVPHVVARRAAARGGEGSMALQTQGRVRKTKGTQGSAANVNL